MLATHITASQASAQPSQQIQTQIPQIQEAPKPGSVPQRLSWPHFQTAAPPQPIQPVLIDPSAFDFEQRSHQPYAAVGFSLGEHQPWPHYASHAVEQPRRERRHDEPQSPRRFVQSPRYAAQTLPPVYDHYAGEQPGAAGHPHAAHYALPDPSAAAPPSTAASDAATFMFLPNPMQLLQEQPETQPQMQQDAAYILADAIPQGVTPIHHASETRLSQYLQDQRVHPPASGAQATRMQTLASALQSHGQHHQLSQSMQPDQPSADSPSASTRLAGDLDESTAHKIKCPYCDRTFQKQYSLKSHLVVHRGTRPYACDVCGQSFARRHDLLRHLRTIHGPGRPFKCAVCGIGLPKEDVVRWHIEFRHPEEPLAERVEETLLAAHSNDSVQYMPQTHMNDLASPGEPASAAKTDESALSAQESNQASEIAQKNSDAKKRRSGGKSKRTPIAAQTHAFPMALESAAASSGSAPSAESVSLMGSISFPSSQQTLPVAAHYGDMNVSATPSMSLSQLTDSFQHQQLQQQLQLHPSKLEEYNDAYAISNLPPAPISTTSHFTGHIATAFMNMPPQLQMQPPSHQSHQQYQASDNMSAYSMPHTNMVNPFTGLQQSDSVYSGVANTKFEIGSGFPSAEMSSKTTASTLASTTAGIRISVPPPHTHILSRMAQTTASDMIKPINATAAEDGLYTNAAVAAAAAAAAVVAVTVGSSNFMADQRSEVRLEPSISPVLMSITGINSALDGQDASNTF